MSALRLTLSLLVLSLPVSALAEVAATDIPGDAIWYVHADLEAMRNVNSGSPLYEWLNGEVFIEIDEDIGIDLNEEVNTVTAFSDAALGTVVVVEGPISKESRDKILALAATDAKLDMASYDGKTYYHAERDSGSQSHNRSLDELAESAYFSFDVENKLIVASDRHQMEALLDSGGKLSGTQSTDGSLFVLTADKEFVQAGMRTAAFADDDDDWDSNILRNTEKAALLVSDRDGLIAVEAQLVSRDPAIARSLGGIINGLISLQAFNSDLEPNVQTLIRNTKIEVKDNVLSINAVFDPEVVVSMLEDESTDDEQ